MFGYCCWGYGSCLFWNVGLICWFCMDFGVCVWCLLIAYWFWTLVLCLAVVLWLRRLVCFFGWLAFDWLWLIWYYLFVACLLGCLFCFVFANFYLLIDWCLLIVTLVVVVAIVDCSFDGFNGCFVLIVLLWFDCMVFSLF